MKTLLVAAALIAFATAAIAQDSMKHLQVTPDALAWKDNPAFPKGIKIATVLGDPTKAGAAQVAYGGLLFQTNCARCHTKAWSFFDPTKGNVPLPQQQGSGAFGPNLTNGDTIRQFPGETGLQQQYDWVANGAEPNKQYGVRGISSGRMPHFGTLLTKEQIDAIIAYERSL